jgi:hypothetical protein
MYAKVIGWCSDLIRRPYALDEHLAALIDFTIRRRHRLNLPVSYDEAGPLESCEHAPGHFELCAWRQLTREAAFVVGNVLSSRPELNGRTEAYPLSYDADVGLIKAVYATVLLGRPSVIVETGVANGISTSVILHALNRIGSGTLYSVDPLDAERMGGQTGLYVPPELRRRWRLVKGSSKSRLREIVKQTGRVDLFLHDSLHTFENITFELETVAALSQNTGTLFIVDDIETHDAFPEFVVKHQLGSMIFRHSEKPGLFGMAYPASHAASVNSGVIGHPSIDGSRFA